MKLIILVILLHFFSHTFTYSQKDTSLSPMQSAILEFLDASGSSEKISAFITLGVDSAMIIFGKEYPEFNLQMKRIIKDETVKFIEDAVSPKGDFFNLISDVYEKYFTADEIKILAATIKSGGGINDSNRVVLTKVFTYKDSLSNDYTKATKIFMKNLKHKFIKRVMQRFEDEGLRLPEDDYLDFD